MWKFEGYEIDEPLDWDHLCIIHFWLEEIKTVEQEPEWHSEGNCYIHTKMVVESLINDEDYKDLSEQDKHIVVASAFMHDIEKRSTTILEDGRLRSPGHSKRGAHTARLMLYEVPFETRECIVNLIRNHGNPIWAIDKKYPDKEVIELSLKTNNKLLYMLSKADVNGRICNDDNDYLERIEMFKELCIENNCFGRKKQFINELHRYSYLTKPENGYEYVPYLEEMVSKVTMFSALPGTGKDYYIKNMMRDMNVDVVSLDDIRREMGVKHGDKKGNGQVIQLAKEKCKEYLRKNEPFIFNATNITRDMRGKWISLFNDYNAITEIIYLEVSIDTLIKQNLDRKHSVPTNTLLDMIKKVDVPDESEAHIISHCTDRVINPL